MTDKPRGDPPTDLRADLAPLPSEPIDPVAMARRDLKRTLPQRFYSDVSVIETGGGFGPALDGKPVRTPAKAALAVPSRALAAAMAEEWAAQTELVEPASMPLTTLVNSAIDGVAHHMAGTAAEIAKFAETDLVCYRAADPQALVNAQAEAWDSVLVFAREALGAHFVCTEGILAVAQPASALHAVRGAVEAVSRGDTGALRLAALSVMTSLTGSVLIALAVAQGAMAPEDAWAAAHVDEDFQMRHWGADAEALARRDRRWREMVAAARLDAALRPQAPS